MEKNTFIGLAVFTYCVVHVTCHGNMVKPYTWFDTKQWIKTDKGYIYDYVGMKSGMMCRTGFEITRDEVCQHDVPDESCEQVKRPGVICYWYTNGTQIEKPTLFDPNLRTFMHAPNQEQILRHPWRAPGSAPIDSPCGVSGGNLHGCRGGNCNVSKGGYAYGRKAEDFQFKHPFYVTNWTRGDVVEVVWGILANHGGGYSYRLCKLPKDGVRGLTEECFQQTPLQFSGDMQWVQFGEDESTRFEFKAMRVSSGTVPEGSQWTRNPIPACIGHLGGFYLPSAECVDGIQFPAPRKDLKGFGVNHNVDIPRFPFSIVDKVLIPKDLEAGEYVLSFRWDTEQTPQVWTTCASISLS